MTREGSPEVRAWTLSCLDQLGLRRDDSVLPEVDGCPQTPLQPLSFSRHPPSLHTRATGTVNSTRCPALLPGFWLSGSGILLAREYYSVASVVATRELACSTKFMLYKRYIILCVCGFYFPELIFCKICFEILEGGQERCLFPGQPREKTHE